MKRILPVPGLDEVAGPFKEIFDLPGKGNIILNSGFICSDGTG
jgi:hypothetical protein